MIRIDDDVRTPLAAWPGAGVETGQPGDVEADVEAKDAAATDDRTAAAIPFLSPPPAPWPRVFPSL